MEESTRESHDGLEIGTQFADWFPRMAAYSFEEMRITYWLLKEETNNPKNPVGQQQIMVLQ